MVEQDSMFQMASDSGGDDDDHSNDHFLEDNGNHMPLQSSLSPLSSLSSSSTDHEIRISIEVLPLLDNSTTTTTTTSSSSTSPSFTARFLRKQRKRRIVMDKSSTSSSSSSSSLLSSSLATSTTTNTNRTYSKFNLLDIQYPFYQQGKDELQLQQQQQQQQQQRKGDAGQKDEEQIISKEQSLSLTLSEISSVLQQTLQQVEIEDDNRQADHRLDRDRSNSNNNKMTTDHVTDDDGGDNDDEDSDDNNNNQDTHTPLSSSAERCFDLAKQRSLRYHHHHHHTVVNDSQDEGDRINQLNHQHDDSSKKEEPDCENENSNPRTRHQRNSLDRYQKLTHFPNHGGSGKHDTATTTTATTKNVPESTKEEMEKIAELYHRRGHRHRHHRHHHHHNNKKNHNTCCCCVPSSLSSSSTVNLVECCHPTIKKCLRGSSRKIQSPPPFNWTETGWTCIGVFVTLLLLFGFNTCWEGWIGNNQQLLQQDYHNAVITDMTDDDDDRILSRPTIPTGLVLGPFGALLTLQYGVTSAPLGQPKNILYGQISSLLIAFVVGSIDVLPVWFRQTLATMLAISFMVRCGITHPPAGAAALLVSGEPNLSLASMGATLIGNIVAIGSACIINNMSSERQYPMSWTLNWPELRDCIVSIFDGLYGCISGCYTACRKNWNIRKLVNIDDHNLDHDDNGDDDEWTEDFAVPTTEPNALASSQLGRSFPSSSSFVSLSSSSTTSSSSTLAMSSSSSSSIRRTQRYSYSMLQWQSLRRANSHLRKSWLSFRSSASLLSTTTTSQPSSPHGVMPSSSSNVSSSCIAVDDNDDDNNDTDTQNLLLKDDGMDDSGDDGTHSNYGSIGLPI